MNVLAIFHSRSVRRATPPLLFAALCIPLSAWAQTYTQTEDITYNDNFNKWVLGQVATQTVDGVPVSATAYDQTYALPETVTSFGKLQQTLTWDTSSTAASGQRGTLKTVKDGNNRTTTLGSWKRGFPQTITFADGTGKSAAVDDNGWITSVTDELGSKTCYGYDEMGRLALITPTSETAAGTCNTSAWLATTLTFQRVDVAEVGIEAGHWRQAVVTGNARKHVYFDALWRPLVQREYDASNSAATMRYQRFAYHPGGQLDFASYPGTTHALTAGTHTDYDALGRVTSVGQDSEIGLLVTLTEYLGGFRTRTTKPGGFPTALNPGGFRTTTTYQVFDEPTYDRPTSIAHPEGAYTHIARDTFGKATRVRRSDSLDPTGGTGINRDYAYNSNHELCRVFEPETRVTLMGYDAARNLAWSARGLSPSITECHETGLTATIEPERVARTYDERNRLTLVNYPAGTEDVTTTYHADGAVASVGAGAATIEYGYNRRRLLTSERLLWNSIDWLIGHGYSANGHEATLTYRDGHQVSFAPNALGQATQAGTYATDATYYPNGALRQFTYGNDIVHTLTQNARQLPERSRDVYGATTFLDDTYDYDQNGNVAAITDGLTGQPGNRDMTYDGLDRLLAVTAGSAQGGGAVFAYDVQDNITRLDQGSRTLRHQYDAVTNRLTGAKNAAGTALFTVAHDIRGNQTSRTSLGVSDTFTFDRANRLTATTIGGTASTYKYDGLGRRLRHIESGVQSYFQYSQAGQLLYSQDGTNRHNHVYLAGSLVAKRSVPYGGGAATIRYQHTDALGSPVAETDEFRAVTRERLTAYGEPADGNWSEGQGFTGHDMDASSKLVYMQQRYYDPMVGRFLSVDPMLTSTTDGTHFNRFVYANANPNRYTDPDGRCATLCTGAVGVVIGGLVGGGMELWKQAKNGQFDGRSLAVETGKGAVVGGLIGLTGGAAAATGASTTAQVAVTTTTGFVAGAEAHAYGEVAKGGGIPALADSAEAGAYTALGAGAGQWVGAIAKPALTVAVPATATHPVVSLSGKTFYTARTPAQTIHFDEAADALGNASGATLEQTTQRLPTGSPND